MENTPFLYHTLVQVLSQPEKWSDLRHLKTLAWMMVGLIQARRVSLTAWVPYLLGRARYAQSTVRRFRRWLDHEKIAVASLYGPLMQPALAAWGAHVRYVALDTSMLWNASCGIRIAVLSRGRAVPLVWTGLEHGSAQVSYDVYKALGDRAAALLPPHGRVVFLADRGCADTDLMAPLRQLGWHLRLRITSSFWLSRRGRCRGKGGGISLARGQACCWHPVWLTDKRSGPVHLAVARPHDGNAWWDVISDEPTDMTTLPAYGWRFDIEENFVDDKSHGFQWESSLIRSAAALTRLCLVLATATLSLVSQGTEVVKQGRRRWVEPHWFRGSSYVKIGWNWVQ